MNISGPRDERNDRISCTSLRTDTSLDSRFRPSLPSHIRAINAGSASRRAAPFEWTSDVTDDLAVFHTGVFINNELRKTPDAACRILCNRRIVRQSADRCLKQHPGELRPHGRDPTGRLQPRNSSNRKSPLSRLATRKQGKPKQYDRGENSPLEKSAKFYRRTATYCLTSKDIQMSSHLRLLALKFNGIKLRGLGRPVQGHQNNIMREPSDCCTDLRFLA